MHSYLFNILNTDRRLSFVSSQLTCSVRNLRTKLNLLIQKKDVDANGMKISRGLKGARMQGHVYKLVYRRNENSPAALNRQ